MFNFLKKFESNTIFSEDEGWMLFRLAAIGEAVGWTLLIIGIVLSRDLFPHNQFPVILAGRVHGMLFVAYVLASVGLYPSMRWSRRRALVALAASVLPYGSLFFEMWARQVRMNQKYQIYKSCITFNLLAQSDNA